MKKFIIYLLLLLLNCGIAFILGKMTSHFTVIFVGGAATLAIDLVLLNVFDVL